MKTLGYLISTLSVLLLGAVSWKSASADPLLAAALVGGMGASIAGMACRWISHRHDKRERERVQAQIVALREKDPA